MLLHDLLAGRSRDAELGGPRVLVVEDEYLIVMDLCEELQAFGAEVIGPAATVADALALLERGPAPDIAVLDIGLGDETVFPVADALRSRGIPFLFATGYDASAIPARFADVLLAQKPMAFERASQTI